MSGDISKGFNGISERVANYHTYIVALFSGVVIGFLTNYLVAYVLDVASPIGLVIGILLLIFSVYLFLLYSPEASWGQVEEILPKSLHEFLYANFDKLLMYVKEDWEGYTFHKKAYPHQEWMCPLDGVTVDAEKRGEHSAEINVNFPFMRFFNCRIKVILSVSELSEIPEYRTVKTLITLNNLAKIHPKTDLVLKTLGRRLHVAVFYPANIYPDIPDEEHNKILKELRPNVWEYYCNKSDKKEE